MATENTHDRLRSPAPATRSRGIPAPGAAPAANVLLVEPHEDTRQLYAGYLAGEGCAVEPTADGREALVRALTQRFHAIVTETRLPGIDGFYLCEVLRRDPATARTPILFLTCDRGLTEERARSMGANAVLVKPCLPDQLVSAVRRFVVDADGAPTAPPPVEQTDADSGRSGVTRPPRSQSRAHHRGNTTTPPLPPPSLVCPTCDGALRYAYSYLGGVSAHNAEQWDYLECPAACGTFEYRHRTRKLRRF